MNHINAAALVTTLRTALFLAASSALAMASEGLAFPVVPTTSPTLHESRVPHRRLKR